MFRILRRFFNTFSVRSGSAVFIRTRPDHNTPEQNRIQIANIIRNHNLLSSFNIIIALAQTVMIRPEDNNRLYVAGSPHIALAAFDEGMEIIEGCYMSKGLVAPKIKEDVEYSGFELVEQKYQVGSRYQDKKAIMQHCFENASIVKSSVSDYSSGKKSNRINNAGGDFYLIVLPQMINRSLLMQRILSYKAINFEYDRMDNNCGHAVLSSLGYQKRLPSGLSTQEAARVILEYFDISLPIQLPDLCKPSFNLGEDESKFLWAKHLLHKDNKQYKDHFQSYFGIDFKFKIER